MKAHLILSSPGAIYGDVSIRMAGYIGEGVRSGTVIAVKTHKQGAIWTDINSPGNIGKVPVLGNKLHKWQAV